MKRTLLTLLTTSLVLVAEAAETNEFRNICTRIAKV